MSAEDDLIARHFAPLAGPAGLGLNDDAALLSPPAGCELVLTADAIVAGVHFFADDPAASIGRKALGVNLSDLAAKGAEPLGFLMTLAIPKAWSNQKRERWLDGFASGLAMLARTSGCPLVGGDTVSTPGPLSVSITAYGSVQAGGLIRRTGAQPGDAVLVTGTIGDAALGLRLRENPQADWAKTLIKAERAHLEERYLHPRPRNLLATHLRGVAHAAMDVSDGLVGDLSKLAGASGERARLEAALVPLSDAARKALAADPAYGKPF
jgi:thiamine-monophosphate kinase